MNGKTAAPESEKRPRPALSIQISEELDARLTAAVALTRLKRSDVARISLEKGLPHFVAQWTGEKAEPHGA